MQTLETASPGAVSFVFPEHTILSNWAKTLSTAMAAIKSSNKHFSNHSIVVDFYATYFYYRLAVTLERAILMRLPDERILECSNDSEMNEKLTKIFDPCEEILVQSGMDKICCS